jgi:geranylgeranyl diphosphate synthase type II
MVLPELDVAQLLAEHRQLIDSELDRAVQLAAPEQLFRSMRYSLLAGGKRLRPTLCLAVCTAGGGTVASALPTAIALEMLHTATLIHDDLPVMDDDDFRRGRPTNHKVFGEQLALLTGDALLSYSLEWVLTQTQAPADRVLRVMHVLLRAIGVEGAIGGQVVDTSISIDDTVELATLEWMYTRKTGALLVAAVTSGAILAGLDEDAVGRLQRYGEHVGLAFQIIDDVLDLTSTLEHLGKRPGQDARGRKVTIPALIGLEAAREQACRLIEAAKDELETLGPVASPLRTIADFVYARSA